MPRFRMSAVAGIAFAAWAGVSAILWFHVRSGVLEETRAQALSLVEDTRDALETGLAVGREDVLILARSPAAVDHAAGKQQARAALAQQFIAYARSRRGVFQVRLLDTAGVEVVRIQRDAQGVRESLRLQDKSQRYYFREARSLQRGQVYVSPIDLNVERGQVERPLRSTVRYATPLWGNDGTLAGVIVINLHADALLRSVQLLSRQTEATLTLVDETGMYLSHPDSSREWGRLLGTQSSLSVDHPALMDVPKEPDVVSTQVGGVLAAVARVRGVPGAPSVVWSSPEGAVMRRAAGSFLPLGVGVIGAGGLLFGLFAAFRRSQRLSEELARESFLRREISQREQSLAEAQERLVASARLAALTDSAAALAHELRNPLAAIVNSASQLREEPGLDDDARTLMGIVLGESERLERAVQSFLQLADRPETRVSAVDLASAAAQVASLAAHDPAFADLTIEHAGPTECLVAADADELRQVLWNLVRNAATANRRSGGKRIVISTQVKGDEVFLDVEDEGPGPGDDGPGRRGIGLIVVAGVAARGGGAFSLESRAPSGARARVTLPRAIREAD